MNREVRGRQQEPVKNLYIRAMRKQDAVPLAEGFQAQGWNKPAEQYDDYYQEQCEGKRQVLIAECDGELAGYVNVLPSAGHGPYMGQKIPEIADFNVYIRFQRRGIGNALLDAAEKLALQKADRVFLGVGMHKGYGAAQRLYIRRGYFPDGSGVWYQGINMEEEAPCRNDDDLVLYLLKELKGNIAQ